MFLTLPFALVGAIVAAFLTGGVLSLGSLVGLVTVIGISARNGIMLVSHYRHLELQEGMAFGRDLVLRGAEERLAPILMTALATGLALVPIVLGGTRAGYEIEHPLAVVILGGLVTSTLLEPVHRAGPVLALRTFGGVGSGRGLAPLRGRYDDDHVWQRPRCAFSSRSHEPLMRRTSVKSTRIARSLLGTAVIVVTSMSVQARQQQTAAPPLGTAAPADGRGVVSHRLRHLPRTGWQGITALDGWLRGATSRLQ